MDDDIIVSIKSLKPKSFNFPLQLNSLLSNPVLNKNEERKMFEKLNVLQYL